VKKVDALERPSQVGQRRFPFPLPLPFAAVVDHQMLADDSAVVASLVGKTASVLGVPVAGDWAAVVAVAAAASFSSEPSDAAVDEIAAVD